MAIEMRPSQALRLLHELALRQVVGQMVDQVAGQVVGGEVRDNLPDLSQRQLAVLLTIYLETPPHTVRGLAARLNVTKPVITRALDSMGELRLVSRRRDEADRRNVVIQRTVEGALYLERIGDLVVAIAKSLPR